MIYFVQAGEEGPIKIGVAENVERRIAGLQVAHFVDLKLRLMLEGDDRHESYLHAKFEPYRMRGEWFKPVVQLLAFIESPEPFPKFSPLVMDMIVFKLGDRQDKFLSSIEGYLNTAKVPAARFGMQAVKDPNFVFELRKGRSPSLGVVERVNEYMAGNPPSHPSGDVPAQDTGQPKGEAA